MRKFTISPRMKEYEFNLLTEKVGDNLPSELFNLLTNYGGNSILECYFKDMSGKTWKMEDLKRFPYIFGFIDEIDEELKIAGIETRMIPFANEETGWLLCISTEKDYPVYVFKSSNYSGREAFQKLTNSFNEFLNDLSREASSN